MTEVKEIIDKVYETIDSLYEMENISNKRLIPIWFNDKEFALVEEEFLTEMNKQIERLLTTKTDTIKIIPEEWQWEVKL